MIMGAIGAAGIAALCYLMGTACKSGTYKK